MQIAKSLGAYVIGTSSAKNRDFVLSLGADEHVDYNGDAMEQNVSNVDFAFDCVGGNVAERSLPLLKTGGQLIGITGIKESFVKQAEEMHINAYFILVESNGEDMRAIADLLTKGILKHIHNKLIGKAKEKLSTTELSVNKIAYELGFQHPQSFNKLFKSKTKMSPLEFRSNFN